MKEKTVKLIALVTVFAFIITTIGLLVFSVAYGR